MPTKERAQRNARRLLGHQPSAPENAASPQRALHAAYKACTAPPLLMPVDILHLQRTIGNQTTSRLFRTTRSALPPHQAQMIQRVQVKNKEGQWEEQVIDFPTLTRAEVNRIRDNIHSLFNPDGTYKLTKSEQTALNKRDSELYNSKEEVEERARKAAEDDATALAALGTALAKSEPWGLIGKPSHMGESDRGFRQNWEVTISIGGLRGVLHLHFNTNDKDKVARDTLGRAHIKTTLTSKAGNIDAPEAMITEAIKQIQST